jgi:hypothetical protein
VVGDPATARTIQTGLLAVPVSVAGVCLAGVLRGLRLGRRFNTTRLFAPTIYCSGIVVLVLVNRITVLAVLTVWVAGIALGTIAAYALIPRPVRGIRHISLEFAAAAYRYGAAASLSGIANQVKLAARTASVVRHDSC